MKFCLEQKFLVKSQVDDWFRCAGEVQGSDSADRVARRSLSRLKRQGWLADMASSAMPGKVWSLTKTGVALLKDQGGVPEYWSAGMGLDAATMNHDRWVTQVRLVSLMRRMSWGWVPEIVLRATSSGKIPDALVEFESPARGLLRLAIEIELTQKSETRLKTIFTEYQNGDPALILYFVATPELLATLKRIAGALCPKAYFCLISDFCDARHNLVWTNRRDSFPNTHFIGDPYVIESK